MLFNSVDFLIFLPITIMIYFVLPSKVRYIWLLLASYYFYMNWNPKYAILILISTLLTYFCGLFLDKINNTDKEEKIKKRLKISGLTISLMINLGILFWFKYTNFLIDNVNRISSMLGLNINMCGLDILLPVGISFYTFQALGYTVDVYRGEFAAEKNVLKYALFVSFFPQLVAGPIERTSNLMDQFTVNHKISWTNFKKGVLWMLWGYLLKLVIADRIAIIVDTIYDNPEDYTGIYIVVATVFFGIQIYCDFNGYTMIARGCAKIMGIDLMENFNAPYLSQSVAEFWRRWHISLSSWFKDYLYIPLGGNRKGRFRKNVNLLIVFLISGFWHGAAWGYVIWGGLNGLYQIVGESLGKTREVILQRLKINKNSFSHTLINILSTFVLVDFSWIFFRAKSFSESKRIIRCLCDSSNGFNFVCLFDGTLFELGLGENEFYYVMIMILVLLVVDLLKYKRIDFTDILLLQGDWFIEILFMALLCVVFMTGIYGVEYDASRFIYFQF